jgi:LAS superfamily LD-carboxypeptidase LdcB
VSLKAGFEVRVRSSRQAPREGILSTVRNRRRHLWWMRAALAVVVSGVVLVPPASQALPVQEGDPVEGDDSGQSAGGEVEVDIEVDRADEADIVNAFGAIRENVEAQQVALNQAEGAVQAADLAVTAAEQKVAAIQLEIDGLVGQSDEVVTRRFVNPPSQAAIEALTADSVADATIKNALLDMQANADAAVLDELHGLEADLEEQREIEEQARTDASDKRTGAEMALADLEDAASQQVTFAREIEQRLERNLGEIEGLKQTDPALAERMQGQIDQLSADLASARVRLEQEDRLKDLDIDLPTVEGPSTIDIDAIEGNIITVTCPIGGSIKVHKDIADSTRDLLNLADQKGVPLCGNGYRSISSQIALRKANCNGNVYSAPASACSPPTARPGASMHERGLAIDFTCNGGSVTSGGVCGQFLRANAPDFGLFNLPSEPWHYSNNGN